MNHVIEIWKNSRGSVRDELGQFPIVKEKHARVWAGVTPQTGSALTGRAADTIVSRTTHKIVIRYRSDITPDMWVLDGTGARYNILYILNPYLANETLEIFCEAVI